MWLKHKECGQPAHTLYYRTKETNFTLTDYLYCQNCNKILTFDEVQVDQGRYRQPKKDADH